METLSLQSHDLTDCPCRGIALLGGPRWGAQVMLQVMSPQPWLGAQPWSSPEAGPPSTLLCRNAAACHPRSEFVSLSPFQTPMGNREPIFELCKVFFC